MKMLDRLGVSTQSFVQVYNILHQAQIQIQLASPEVCNVTIRLKCMSACTHVLIISCSQGKNFELVNQDDTNRKWVADFRSKSYSHPIAIESIDGKMPQGICYHPCSLPFLSLAHVPSPNINTHCTFLQLVGMQLSLCPIHLEQ